MKRIISVVCCIAVVLTCSALSFADFDLSGMSYDELIELKDKINLAIWQSDEWQEVEVPQGVWIVGEDIPAGKWTIKATTGNTTFIMVGDEPTEYGTSVKASVLQVIYDKEASFYDEKTNITSWTIDLIEGKYVGIENGNAVFTPYVGKPSLGFKK